MWWWRWHDNAATTSLILCLWPTAVCIALCRMWADGVDAHELEQVRRRGTVCAGRRQHRGDRSARGQVRGGNCRWTRGVCGRDLVCGSPTAQVVGTWQWLPLGSGSARCTQCSRVLRAVATGMPRGDATGCSHEDGSLHAAVARASLGGRLSSEVPRGRARARLPAGPRRGLSRRSYYTRVQPVGPPRGTGTARISSTLLREEKLWVWRVPPCLNGQRCTDPARSL